MLLKDLSLQITNYISTINEIKSRLDELNNNPNLDLEQSPEELGLDTTTLNETKISLRNQIVDTLKKIQEEKEDLVIFSISNNDNIIQFRETIDQRFRPTYEDKSILLELTTNLINELSTDYEYKQALIDIHSSIEELVV